MTIDDAKKLKEGNVLEFRSKNEDYIEKTIKSGFDHFIFISFGNGYLNIKKLNKNGKPGKRVSKLYSYHFEYYHKID